jgi:hypothetical protein
MAMGRLCKKRQSLSEQEQWSIHGSVSKHGSRMDGRLKGRCNLARGRKRFPRRLSILSTTIIADLLKGEAKQETPINMSEHDAKPAHFVKKQLAHALKYLLGNNLWRFVKSARTGRVCAILEKIAARRNNRR